ncbi:MAG: hypothetical protein HYV02_07245 [Deltaproteobacteria bacterium]|nr:hypothetical protein [Deltaproteobacteria bacterium]
MQFRLILDRDHIDQCRKMGREIAAHLERYAGRHTSTAVERATLRALGVEGAVKGASLVGAVVDALGRERLRDGAAYWLGFVMQEKQCDPTQAAQHIVRAGMPEKSGRIPHGDIRKVTRAAATPFMDAVATMAGRRAVRRRTRSGYKAPQLHVRLMTGVVDHDLRQAKELLQRPEISGITIVPPLQSADEQLSTHGRGWRTRYDVTEAMRCAVDLCGKEEEVEKHVAPLYWAAHSLAAPEMSVMMLPGPSAGIEYDAVTMASCEQIALKRVIVDQWFVYRLMARGGASMVMGSDRWWSRCSHEGQSHEVLCATLLVEAMAAHAGIRHEHIGQRHQFPLSVDDGAGEDVVLNAIAFAQLVRELFPQVPLSYLLSQAPQTGYVGAVLSLLCEFSASVIDWGREKSSAKDFDAMVHRAKELSHMLGGIGAELVFMPNGRINRRAATLLDRIAKTLRTLHRRDFLKAAADASRKGLLAMPEEGIGFDGVIQTNKYYWNPLADWLGKTE